MNILIELIESEIFNTLFLIVKIILASVGFAFLGFVIFMLFRTEWARFKYNLDVTEFFTFRPYGVRRISKQWAKIEKRLDSGDESEYKLAVIEADDIFGEILKRLGISGKTLSERLLNITPTIIPNLDDVISAHQTRDSIVHDPNFKLSLNEAQKILEVFGIAFRGLDLL